MTIAKKSTQRFLERRQLIIDSATEMINRHGVKGTTFTELAASIGLNTTSVTYYFKKKHMLAAAVFDQTLDRLMELAKKAASEKTPKARVRKFIDLNFEYHADVRKGQSTTLANLSDIRTLDGVERERLSRRFQHFFRNVRELLGPFKSAKSKALQTAKAHVLIESIFWLPGWLPGIDLNDFDRISQHMYDVFESGLVDRLSRNLKTSEPMPSCDTGMEENFLRAATVLINERGYLGASVERIASELNVTKGSFYHHIDAKDDLVIKCFNRSLTRISDIQKTAKEIECNKWEQLYFVIIQLLEIQFNSEAPLLRTTALAALPRELRLKVLARTNQIAISFSGLIVDGMIEGSIRPVDPLVASQMLMAMINSACDMRNWASAPGIGNNIETYASTVCTGVFSTT